MGWQLLRIDQSVRAFRANVLHDVLQRYDYDFSAMDADELVDAWDALRAECSTTGRRAIVGDTRVMMCSTVSDRPSVPWGLDDEGTLHTT